MSNSTEPLTDEELDGIELQVSSLSDTGLRAVILRLIAELREARAEVARYKSALVEALIGFCDEVQTEARGSSTRRRHESDL